MLAFLFSRVRDPRGAQGVRYPLGPMLHRAVLATLAGCDGIRSMERWCGQHHEEINAILGTHWRKAPSFGTWQLLFKALGNTDFEPALGTVPAQAGEMLHIDGKALCGSVKKGSPMTFITSVFRGVDKVALTTRCHGRGGEVEAARAALAHLSEKGNLKGVWLTFDALHTQKKQLI